MNIEKLRTQSKLITQIECKIAELTAKGALEEHIKKAEELKQTVLDDLTWEEIAKLNQMLLCGELE